jgi:hypothetical protein
MKNFLIVILTALLFVGFVFFAPNIRGAINNWRHGIQTVDDRTRYETLRQVEDTARAMMASHSADSLMWEQFKDSDVQEERNWANGARMRANRTAANYNEFMLKNSYVWQFGIPGDIFRELPTI